MTDVEHNMIFITAKKIWCTLLCTVAFATLRCTVVGPQIAKPKKSAQARIKLRTSHLHVHRPTRYPDKTFQGFDYDCILTQAWCGTQGQIWTNCIPGNAACPNSHVTFCSLPVSTRIKVYYVNLYQQKSNKLGVLGTKTGWPILAMYGICRQRPTT